MSFEGQHILITGAASGIGKAATLRFLEEGAKVTATDLNEEALAEMAAQDHDGRLRVSALDVSDWDAVHEVVRAAADEFGTIDVGFNCAGHVQNAMLHKEGIDAFDKMVNVHLHGAYCVLRALMPAWMERGRGKMIFVSSPAALEGQIGGVSYSAAKAGLLGLMKGAARELARYNINVNAILPIAATPMTENARTNDKINAKMLANIPLGRWAQPEEIIPGVLYLASRDSDYVTGLLLRIDGGRSL